MKKISVIIPCYNAAKYLPKCIRSLLAQTLDQKYLEFIFVNDGSGDRTSDLLTELEQEHPDLVMVIHLEKNMRQGTARNIAMEYATGEYLGFVDADDWIEPDMYESLYTQASRYKCDMAGGLILRETPSGVYQMPNHLRTGTGIIIGADKRLRMDLILNGNNGGICSKIFRREMIMEHALLFPEQMSYEDNYWLSMTCLHINRYMILDQHVYHYLEHPSSTVFSKKRKDIEDRLSIEVMKLSGYAKKGFLKDYYIGIEAAFCRNYFVDTLVSLMEVQGTIPMDLYEKMRTEVINYFPDFPTSPLLTPPDKKILESIYNKKTQKQLEIMAKEYLCRHTPVL